MSARALRARSPIRRAVASVGAVLLTAALASCANTSPGATGAASGLCNAKASPTVAPTKLVVIIGENESEGNVDGQAAATAASFEQALSSDCASLRNMRGLTHGSESNYLGLVAGSYPQWGLCDLAPDRSKPSCPYSPSSKISGPSLFSQLEGKYGAHGWRVYAESMNTPCQQADGSGYHDSSGQYHAKYVVRHNPAPYFSALTSCADYDVPLGDSVKQTGAFYHDAKHGQLPRVSFVIPNDINNGHDTTLTDYDNFLKRTVTYLSHTSDYRDGKLRILITYDEGTVKSGSHARLGENCLHPQPANSLPSCEISAWVVGRYVPAMADHRLESHYSVLKSIEQWAGLPLLGHAADASTNSLDPRLLPTS